MRVGDLRLLAERAEPRCQLPVTAPVERVEERAPGEGRLRLRGVGQRRLGSAQQEIRDAARRDRGGRRLELADRERLLREPGRGVAFIDDDAVVLRRVARGHMRQLIDGAALCAELTWRSRTR